ncbi:hypothetical protein AB0P21_02225 [Kribbella sp. NPDC056861]|uniref:hypothetical protein n=1 Tax=Kribbella sp. NPDC056861 TaxID=3154857 RepID=UPI003422737A
MDEEIIELLLAVAKDELAADLDHPQPGALSTVLYDVLPYSGSVRDGWIEELRVAFPQFLSVLRQTGRGGLADLLAGEAGAAFNDPELGRADPVSWSLRRRAMIALGNESDWQARWEALSWSEQNALAGPVERPVELPVEPLPGSPAPVAEMPTRLEAEAENSEFLGELAEFAQRVVENRADKPDHELWRIAVMAGWVCPSPVRPQYGPAMHAWTAEVLREQQVEAWLETYRVALTEWSELIEPLLVAFRDGSVAVPDSAGMAMLRRLGAVVVEDGQLRVTPIGVRGLFTRGRWADPQYWLLKPGEWWLNLRPDDLIALVTAASKLCLVDQAWTVQRWFDKAEPLEFAYQLVGIGKQVHGAALNTVFGYLLRIGLEAAPAVEEWLVVEELSGLGWRWFDAIGAPQAGIPTEHARFVATSEMVQSLDDLRALLDRYADCPPVPPLPGSTIDELTYSIPTLLRTEQVNGLLQRVLNTEVEELPVDRAELYRLIAETRRSFLE